MKPIKIEKKQLGKYAVAPYNFVSFPKKCQVRYKNVSELPKHNSFKGKDDNPLLSGYIKYRLKAETPIIVSAGLDKDKVAKFFTNADGAYAIPGSTIRGMVKTNAYILSFSSIVGNKNKKGKYTESNIEDSTYLYREVKSDNSFGIKYTNLLGIHTKKRIAQNVKAGFIVNKEGKFYIEPSEELIEGKSYFRVDEIELRKIVKNKDIKGVYFMYDEELLKEEEKLKLLNKSLSEARRVNDKKRVNNLLKQINEILKRYENNENNKSPKPYEPYVTEISFEYDKSKGKITRIGKTGIYKYKGFILSGGFILGKRSHYIVPESKKDIGVIKIHENVIENYKDDLIITKKAKKTSEGIKIDNKYEFWKLPENNERKPVFYININNTLHFGFTPYMRVFYSKSVLDGVTSGCKDIDGISYVDAMFGFSNKTIKNEEISYKSRISFEDAVAIENVVVDEESSIDMLLAEPKPTSYNLYLVQKDEDKKELSVYDGKFNIRGIKQYWLKDYIEIPDVKNKKMSFKICPLKEGTCFEGKIYFNNLYKDELGLLLWSLKLDEGCYQNVGLAKPYGFGRVKVNDIDLYIEDLDKKYGSFNFDYMTEEDVDKYINYYKEFFSKEKLNGENIDEEKSVKELMFIKKKILSVSQSNDFRYMELNEFRSKQILPDISYYIQQSDSIHSQTTVYNPILQERKTKDKRKHNNNNAGRLIQNPFSVLKDMKVEE